MSNPDLVDLLVSAADEYVALLAPKAAPVVRIVLHTADTLVHELTAEEVERIRKARETGEAAGAAAYKAAQGPFHKAGGS